MKKNLTKKQFEKAASYFPRLAVHNREMARLVLVEGWTRVEAAEQYGATRQMAERWVNRIYETYVTKEKHCPSGWLKKEVCLPEELMREVEEMEKTARLKLE
jgi:hypothetical protein